MSLREGDLKDLISEVFEVDGFQSKMGDDKNIITVSFNVEGRDPANDLANFLEKGYSFVLDSDATPGEQSDGTHKVFVEMERNNDIHDNILEIISGVKELAEIDDFKFRYYKGFKSKPVSEEELVATIPNDPENYGLRVDETNLDNYKNFFNNSFVESVEMLENKLLASLLCLRYSSQNSNLTLCLFFNEVI